MKIAVCEDEKAYLDHLCRMLEELSGKNRFDTDIALASSTREELERFLKTETADVYLLDINLKSGTEGYELALRIKQSQPQAYIVFISENLGMVFQSFKAHPFDFLPKPVSKNVLANLLTDIDRHMAARNQEPERDDAERYITVRSAAKKYHINKDDIIMIEKPGKRLSFIPQAPKSPAIPPLRILKKCLLASKPWFAATRALSSTRTTSWRKIPFR